MRKDTNRLVSVIVPIYKVEADLPNCVQSICNQTYTNLEIILVDDGSPDNCGQMCDEFAKNDTRIKVIHKVNGGLSQARNAGMRIMTGEYVTFVDSDDILELNFVEEMLKLIYKYEAQIAVCMNSTYNKNAIVNKKIVEKETSEQCFDAVEATRNMLYQKGFDVAAWGKMYHKDTLQGISFPDGLIHEDIPTTYKALIRCQKVAFTTRELYCYQIREASIENQKFTIKKMDCIKTAQMMLEDISNNHPELLKAAQSRYVAANFHILAQIKNDIPEKKMIINNIKQVRNEVIRDKSASIRVRGACMLSCFGFNITIAILNLIKAKQ